MNNKEIIVPLSTLEADYGKVSGTSEIYINTSQTVLYVMYKAGSAGDTLYIRTDFGPNPKYIFPTSNSKVETTLTTLTNRDYKFVDVAGTTPFRIFNEVVGELLSVDAHETQTYLANKKRLNLEFIPKTGTTVVIRHNGTAFGTVTEKANDAAFTAPASLAEGTVEWSLATGNLNFSNTDLANYNGQEISADYNTLYNLIRIPIPTADGYMKVGFKETAASAYGTVKAVLQYGPNFK